jgi:hypothetical protein
MSVVTISTPQKQHGPHSTFVLLCMNPLPPIITGEISHSTQNPFTAQRLIRRFLNRYARRWTSAV